MTEPQEQARVLAGLSFSAKETLPAMAEGRAAAVIAVGSAAIIAVMRPRIVAVAPVVRAIVAVMRAPVMRAVAVMVPVLRADVGRSGLRVRLRLSVAGRACSGCGKSVFRSLEKSPSYSLTMRELRWPWRRFGREAGHD